MGLKTFLDIETTGLHLRRRPWEIAFIQETEGEPEPRELVIQITDVDLTDAQDQGLKVGRFYDRHVDYAQIPDRKVLRFNSSGDQAELDTADQAHRVLISSDLEPGTIVAVDERTAAVLVAWWTAGADMIGLNTSFDTTTLSWMLDRHGLNPEPWDYHITNVATEAAGWLRGLLQAALTNPNGGDPAGPAAAIAVVKATLARVSALPRDTAWLSWLCGVNPPELEERHTALGDARWVRRWWNQIESGVVGRA